MKNGSNKKILIIAGLVMVLFLTAFWSWNMPKLINADRPFIDLSGSIGESIGNANEAYEKSVLTPAPTDAPLPTTTPVPTDIPDITDPDTPEVRIVVGSNDYSGSGETVYVDGVEINSPDMLLSKSASGEVEVILTDDYAEAGTMAKIKGVLEEYGINYRFESVE